MIRATFLVICSFGAGVALMDTLQPKKCEALQTYAEPMRLTNPIQCDAVVNSKCYIRGMRK